MSDAVIITGTQTHYDSVMAEYHYIKQRYADKGTDYQIEQQKVLKAGRKHYDVVTVKSSDGNTETIFFDITESHDKFIIYPQ